MQFSHRLHAKNNTIFKDLFYILKLKRETKVNPLNFMVLKISVERLNNFC